MGPENDEHGEDKAELQLQIDYPELTIKPGPPAQFSEPTRIELLESRVNSIESRLSEKEDF